MELSHAVKPLNYLQDHAPDLIQQFARGEQQTFVITAVNTYTMVR